MRGQEGEVLIKPGTLAFALYGKDRATEQFLCNYGVNEAYSEQMFTGGLVVSGTDTEGNVRMVERPSHPFFVATLFVPQLSSRPGEPHPLVTAFVNAAAAFARSQG